jgi:hypothetical protein
MNIRVEDLTRILQSQISTGGLLYISINGIPYSISVSDILSQTTGINSTGASATNAQLISTSGALLTQISNTGLSIYSSITGLNLTYTTGDQSISGIKTFNQELFFGDFLSAMDGNLGLGQNGVINSKDQISILDGNLSLISMSGNGNINIIPNGGSLYISGPINFRNTGYFISPFGITDALFKFGEVTPGDSGNCFFEIDVNNGFGGWNRSLYVDNDSIQLFQADLDLRNNQIIDVNSITFTDSSEIFNGIISDSNALPSLNWNGRILSGNWTASNLFVSGNPVLTANLFNNYTGNQQCFITGIISTGLDNYFIKYPLGAFSKIPKVVITVEVSGNNIYGINITGRTPTGFSALFSDIIRESGVFLNCLATIN